tara:strand:+ start:2044 stop:2283 length:240 start_codon:yes stop_codon:yes gene_type:complete
MNYKLSITEGEDYGSFIYSLTNERDYYNTKDLRELVECISELEFEVLKEKPHYHRINNQDIEIIEGLRKKLIESDYYKI